MYRLVRWRSKGGGLCGFLGWRQQRTPLHSSDVPSSMNIRGVLVGPVAVAGDGGAPIITRHINNS